MQVHKTQMWSILSCNWRFLKKNGIHSITFTFINFHSLEIREIKVQHGCFNKQVYNKAKTYFKVQLSPKCNLGFFCECMSQTFIISTKEALLRLTIFSFSGQTHFKWEC